MRLVGIASIVFVLALTFVMSGFGPAVTAQRLAGQSRDDDEPRRRNGQAIFRFDTFGDEQLWTDVLRMHEVIATVDPATALELGSRFKKVGKTADPIVENCHPHGFRDSFAVSRS